MRLELLRFLESFYAVCCFGDNFKCDFLLQSGRDKTPEGFKNLRQSATFSCAKSRVFNILARGGSTPSALKLFVKRYEIAGRLLNCSK